MKNLIKYILFAAIIFSFSGCILARVLAFEEMAVLRGTAIRGAVTRLAVTSEIPAMRLLSRVRVKPGIGSSRLLYVPELNGGRPVFELINQSTIKRLATGEVIPLPFRIFRVNGFAKAELRSGPGTTYKLYRTLQKDCFVLVREEVPGWFKVQADEIIGWVAAAVLTPAVKEEIKPGSSLSQVTYTNIDCYNCEARGNNPCEDCKQSGIENCPSCAGKGKHSCKTCKGTGQYTCLLCKGKNKEGCPSCKGAGFLNCGACKAKGYFDCSLCRSTGKIPCAVCDGSLHVKCYYCFGTAKVLKRNEK